MNEPFGRQPLPVTVKVEGDSVDVAYWLRGLRNFVEYRGDNVQRIDDASFKIYPHAVND